MKITSIAIATVLTFTVPSVRGEEDRIRKAVENGLVTKAFLETLAHDDVPEKWRERMEEETKDRYFLRTYFRGDKKALTVMWSKDWVGDKAKMFVATVYDGDTRISKITRIGDAASIFPADAESGYKQIVSLKDDGTVMVVITHNDGYLEGIEVKGRETNLMDDLEFTKAAISMEHIVAPLIESITGQLDSTDKNRKKKDKRNRDNGSSGTAEESMTGQDDTGHPATGSGSKPQGSDKLQPESEGSSR